MSNWTSSVDSGLGSSVDHCVLFVAAAIHLEFLDVLAVVAVAFRKADPAPRSTSTTDRALPTSAVQVRRGRMLRGSERIRTTSAVSIATSAPAPIDTEVGLRECRRFVHSISRPRAVRSGLRPMGSGSTKTEDGRQPRGGHLRKDQRLDPRRPRRVLAATRPP
jgi:hypothetical protein